MKQSAGILLYRRRVSHGSQEPHGGHNGLEVFLVHPGGPFFAKKDLGSWSIPKGEITDNEDPLAAAIREFREETGTTIQGAFVPLTAIRQKGGKTVQAWAVEGDIDAAAITSNTFTLAWPPKAGTLQTFPEVDRAAWFDAGEAKRKVNEAQMGLITELETLV